MKPDHRKITVDCSEAKASLKATSNKSITPYVSTQSSTNPNTKMHHSVQAKVQLFPVQQQLSKTSFLRQKAFALKRLSSNMLQTSANIVKQAYQVAAPVVKQWFDDYVGFLERKPLVAITVSFFAYLLVSAVFAQGPEYGNIKPKNTALEEKSTGAGAGAGAGAAPMVLTASKSLSVLHNEPLVVDVTASKMHVAKPTSQTRQEGSFVGALLLAGMVFSAGLMSAACGCKAKVVTGRRIQSFNLSSGLEPNNASCSNSSTKTDSNSSALNLESVTTAEEQAPPIQSNKTQQNDSDLKHLSANTQKEKGNAKKRLVTTPQELAYVSSESWTKALVRRYTPVVKPLSRVRSAVVCSHGARDYNEDYATQFTIKGMDFILIADGCGGHPDGNLASCIAVKAASTNLAQNAMRLGEADLHQNSDQRLQSLVTRAMKAASTELSTLGSSYWQNHELRTTLMILGANQNRYTLAWIGDGGCVVRRRSGQWEELLCAHKGVAEDGEVADNILSASLGPVQMGKPSMQSTLRLPGDQLYMGSDGVFDPVEDYEKFWAWFRDGLQDQKSPQKLMEQVVDACSTDSAFDDNITAAFLDTPIAASASPSPSRYNQPSRAPATRSKSQSENKTFYIPSTI